MIALIDYGAGNLTSVRKALAALGAQVSTPATPSDLERARGVIVPGVGNFQRTSSIDADWRGVIIEAVEQAASFLGICLGLQFCRGSTEADCEGMALMSGQCVQLKAEWPSSAQVG